jgi:hypothetical protein
MRLLLFLKAAAETVSEILLGRWAALAIARLLLLSTLFIVALIIAAHTTKGITRGIDHEVGRVNKRFCREKLFGMSLVFNINVGLEEGASFAYLSFRMLKMESRLKNK